MIYYQIIISLVFAAMLFGIGAIISIFVKNLRKKLPFTDRYKYSTGAYFCILIALLNWFFNMGDIRIMLMTPILIHMLLFFGITYFASGYVACSEALEKSVAMGIVTFLFIHLLLPDFSAERANTYYLFFGMIYSDQMATACLSISLIALLVNIYMLVRQLYLAIKLR